MKPRNCYKLPNQDLMNKTEQAYAHYLEDLRRMTEQMVSQGRAVPDPFVIWKFEAMKLRLAKNTFYTPDFLLVYKEHFEIHEVKGFWREDARVKIKVAAQEYPWFKFRAVTKGKAEDGYLWNYEDF